MSSTTFFIIFIPILAVILLAVNLILAPHNPYQEKDSVFECGFHSFLGQNRTQFSVSFFIFGLLFLLFDLEILLVYPYSVSGYTNNIYGLAIMMAFFLLLTLGFVFELGKNALTIDSRQSDSYGKKNTDTPVAFFAEPDFINKFALLHSSTNPFGENDPDNTNLDQDMPLAFFAEPDFINKFALLYSSTNPFGGNNMNNTNSDQDMPDRSPLDEAGQYDSDGSDESTYVPLSAEAAKRNEDDLEKLEILQDKERELQKVYENAELVLLSPDASKITEQQHNDYIDDDQPDLNDLSSQITKVREEIKELEDKMESRRQPGYEPSERSDSPSNNSPDAPNNQPVPETGDTGESTEFILPVMFILSTEISLVSIFCIIYKLYKIDFFKFLRSYFLF